MNNEDYKYKYFVSYAFQYKSNCGFSCADIHLMYPIRTFEDIQYISELIKNDNNYEVVTILNWKRYEEVE